MNPCYTAARDYLRLGLHPIPCAPRSKIPIVEWKSYQDTPPLPDEIDEWWLRNPDANVALVLGRGTFAVDLDGGPAAEKLLTDKGIFLPGAPRSKTATGYHVLLSAPGPVPDKVALLSTHGHKPQVDIRGVGIIVAPPSIHPDGPQYEWYIPLQLPFPPAPQALLDLIRTAPSVSTVVGPSGPGWVAQAVRGAPEGQRDATCTRLAGYLLGHGLDPESVEAILVQSFAANCTPPFPVPDVQKCVRSIAKRHFAFGGAQVATETRGLEFVDAGTFLRQDFPPPLALVEGILSSEGSGWISGEEKLGKSYYMLEEALCLALGRPVCGRFAVPKRQRVLLIEEEDPPRRVHSRMKALLRGYDLDPDARSVQDDLADWFKLEVFSGFTFDKPEMLQQLDTVLAQFMPAVVYVDVLRKVTFRDLNKANEVALLLESVDVLRRRHQLLFRIIAHYRKSQGFRSGRGSQEIGGSANLGAWAESSIFFEPIGREGKGTFVQVQNKDGGDGPKWRLKWETSGGTHVQPNLVRLSLEDVKTETTTALHELVLHALSVLVPETPLSGSPGVTAQSIAEQIKKRREPVSRALNQLEKEEKVEEVGTIRGEKGPRSRVKLWALCKNGPDTPSTRLV